MFGRRQTRPARRFRESSKPLSRRLRVVAIPLKSPPTITTLDYQVRTPLSSVMLIDDIERKIYAMHDEGVFTVEKSTSRFHGCVQQLTSHHHRGCWRDSALQIHDEGLRSDGVLSGYILPASTTFARAATGWMAIIQYSRANDGCRSRLACHKELLSIGLFAKLARGLLLGQ